MQSSTSVCCSLIPSGDHVVDWQLVRSADTVDDRRWETRDLGERIKALEGPAMALLRELVPDPRAHGGRRTLSALNSEIAALRAELAWRKVAEPPNPNPR